jgi:AraC-like DNA-binding protein
MAVPQFEGACRPVSLRGGTELTRCLLRTMLRFIDEHIEDPHLAPGRVANEFHISKRYVHKVFAAAGMTFGTYVPVRRGV